jgi:hypothetical protein
MPPHGKQTRLKESCEGTDDAYDLASQAIECTDREHRVASVVDGYLKGRVGLHFHARARLFSDPKDFCIVLKGIGRLEGKLDFGVRVTNDIQHFIGVDGVGEGNPGEKPLVLVSVREGRKAAEQGKARSIRLRPLNDCPFLSGRVDSMEWAKATLGWVPNPPIKLGLGVHDWKARMASGSIPLREHHLPHQQVKGCSEVLDNIAGDSRKLGRDRLDNGPNQNPIWLRVVIEGNLVRASFQKRFCDLFEAVAVLPGPGDLDPARC